MRVVDISVITIIIILSTELSIGISSPITTTVSGPVHLRDVMCNGSESNLLECFSTAANQNDTCSSHIFDAFHASVACVGKRGALRFNFFSKLGL